MRQQVGKWSILFLGVLFGFVVSCGGTSNCINGIQTTDYNTSGLQCTKSCDCSNLKYEGYCINSTCVSTVRSPAQRKGEIRSCKLLQKVGACEWGQQEAQPEPLKELLWGNCLPPTIVPENTAALCSDGKDNDCNGTVDDKDLGCKSFCVEGRSEPCYRGEKATLNQGSCRAGFRTCQPNGGWGTCEGEVVPKAEVCNAQDDDCNGLIDDGLVGCHTTEKCLEGSQKPCYTEPMGCVLETLAGGAKGFRCVGGCQTGTQRCVGGLWGLCEGAVSPAEERCDGIDNNCDGKVDEICACQAGEQRLCFLGPQNKEVGVCKAGTQQCKDGVWGACDGAVAPSPETCDGQDNDCDGTIDESCGCTAGTSRVCFLGPQQRAVGECTAGKQHCVAEKWGVCDGAGKPSIEVCDGLDNDCDGVVDEDCGCSTDAQCPNGMLCFRGVCQSRPFEETVSEPMLEPTLDAGNELMLEPTSDGSKEPTPEQIPEIAQEVVPETIEIVKEMAPEAIQEATPSPGPMAYGENCAPSNANQRCQAGLICLTFPNDTIGICSRQCNTSSCPSGSRCETINSTTGDRACFVNCTTVANCLAAQRCDSRINACYPDPNRRDCRLSDPLGSCSSYRDCCVGQNCLLVGAGHFCGACSKDSDCPKIGGFVPTSCCSQTITGQTQRFCATTCP
ncbi:hypothetical protein L6R29_18640 [Myxococcota bacterium]|nr:hypothetical protein [Myxococcota bacterium]